MPNGLLKRKRKSCEYTTNDENGESLPRTHSGEERCPLAELSVLRIGKKRENLDFDTPSKSHHDEPGCSRSKARPPILRESPFPELEWADSRELWWSLLMQEELSLESRDPDYFDNHPNLQPRMRSVLLEWIIEVAEVYKLQRETFYLCLDYLDRYLTLKKHVLKNQLQLIGVTCLLIASKVEEIYPPKVQEFAYVTDGSCTEDDIVQMEVEVVRSLDWKCSVLTPHSWLCAYLQIMFKAQKQFIFPQYPPKVFKAASRLLDLAVLDEGCLNFSYGVLAASVLYVVYSEEKALSASGLSLLDVEECVSWLRSFWRVLDVDEEEIRSETGARAPSEYSHLLQDKSVSLSLLEEAQRDLRDRRAREELQRVSILTPPSSSKKPRKFFRKSSK